MRAWLGLPIDASAHAAGIDEMIVLVHWLMLVLFVGWLAYFLYVLVRFRAGRQPRADYAGVRGHFSNYVEAGVIVAEAVLLAGFAIPAWATRVSAFPEASEATVVRVVAEQFAWNAHYAGPDGKFGRTSPSLVTVDNPLGIDRGDPAAADDVTLINELNLPIDRPVLVYLSSKDVIHSFSLPEMRVKQDAIPGWSVPVWFQPTRVTPEGTNWEINCSQLCGLGHYRMRGFYRVMTRAAYDAWMNDEVESLKAAAN